MQWDEFFFRHVYLAASKSKDQSTKIGAVLVRNNRVIGEGYNGFPRLVNDDLQSRHDRNLKYYFAEHSERNVIYNCAFEGIRTEDSTLYTSATPCADCCRAIIQSGVSEVVVHQPFETIFNEYRGEKWAESQKASKEMLFEAMVSLRFVYEKFGVEAFIGGEKFQV